jgi:hypothetical protein
MKRALACLFLMAACRHESTSPGPIAPCPASPRVFTIDEMDDYLRRQDECRETSCDEALRAEAKGVLVSVPTLTQTASAFAEQGGDGDALDELREIKDHACVCANAACAEQVQLEFEVWAQRWADTEGTHVEAEAAGAIAEEISECMVKAMMSDGSSRP